MVDENAVNSTRKKIVGRTACGFIAVMLLLTFLSSTINNLGLIRVESADVKTGVLVYRVEKQATVTPVNLYEVYAEHDLRVASLRVKNGEEVKKGQLLAKFDVRGMEDEIRTKTLQLESKNMEKELLAYTYDLDVESSGKAAADAQKELLAATELYEAGAETPANVEKLRKVYEAADRDYRKLLEEKAANLALKQKEAEMLRQSIDMAKTDLERSEAVYSPVDGYLWEINVREGTLAGTSQPAFKVAGPGGVCTEFTVGMEEGKWLAAGDRMTVTIPVLDHRKIEAEISSVNLSQTENGIRITALMDDPELKGGERINISITKESEFFDVIIPNSAVRTDSSGRKFAYVIKERKSPLGREYYLQKAFIYAAASDQKETAVSSGLSPFEKVVTESDRLVMAGDRVKIHRE